MLKTIRMLTVGPNKNYSKGSVVDVDEARAATLIENGDAEEVKTETPKVKAKSSKRKRGKKS